MENSSTEYFSFYEKNEKKEDQGYDDTQLHKKLKKDHYSVEIFVDVKQE